MGNEIGKRYEVDLSTPSASGGHDMAFKVFLGKRKKDGVPVSIFLFEKECLKSLEKSQKARVDARLALMRREIKALTDISCPSILKIYESFEENKKIVAFVTEPVAFSLANALGRGPFLSAGRRREVEELELLPMEVSRGFCSLLEALKFVHEHQRVHFAVCPEHVFVTPSGEWKLAGLGFAQAVDPADPSVPPHAPVPFFSGAEQPLSLPARHPVPALTTTPNLHYAAPELTAAARPARASARADMFSLGVVALEAFGRARAGRPGAAGVLNLGASGAASVDRHRQAAAALSLGAGAPSARFGAPPELEGVLLQMVQPQEASRLASASAALEHPYFSRGDMSILRYLAGLPQRDAPTKASFIANLSANLDLFPKKVQRAALLPPLLDAAVATPQLWPRVLPLLFGGAAPAAAAPAASDPFAGAAPAAAARGAGMLTGMDPQAFKDTVAPRFRHLFGGAAPPEALAAGVARLPEVLALCDDGFAAAQLLPALLRCLDGPPEACAAALRAVPPCAGALKRAAGAAPWFDEELLPRCGRLLVAAQAGAGVRRRAVALFAACGGMFAAANLRQGILPALKICAEKHARGAADLCMCIVGAMDALQRLPSFPKEALASQVVPAVAPFLADKALSAAQFDAVARRVKRWVEEAAADGRKGRPAPSEPLPEGTKLVDMFADGQVAAAARAPGGWQAPGAQQGAPAPPHRPQEPQAPLPWGAGEGAPAAAMWGAAAGSGGGSVAPAAAVSAAPPMAAAPALARSVDLPRPKLSARPPVAADATPAPLAKVQPRGTGQGAVGAGAADLFQGLRMQGAPAAPRDPFAPNGGGGQWHGHGHGMGMGHGHGHGHGHGMARGMSGRTAPPRWRPRPAP